MDHCIPAFLAQSVLRLTKKKYVSTARYVKFFKGTLSNLKEWCMRFAYMKCYLLKYNLLRHYKIVLTFLSTVILTSGFATTHVVVSVRHPITY